MYPACSYYFSCLKSCLLSVVMIMVMVMLVFMFMFMFMFLTLYAFSLRMKMSMPVFMTVGMAELAVLMVMGVDMHCPGVIMGVNVAMFVIMIMMVMFMIMMVMWMMMPDQTVTRPG